LLRAEPRFRNDRSRSSNRYYLALEGGGDWNQLEYPKGLSALEGRLAGQLLAEFPIDLAQQILETEFNPNPSGSSRPTVSGLEL